MANQLGLAEVRKISNVFNSSLFDNLQNKEFNRLLMDNQIVSSKKISSTFDYYYSILNENYRNEYVYKNEIANKIFLKKYNINEATFLSEVPVRNSITDLVIINNTISAYEIKTEYDTLERLKTQIEDYRKVFDKIFIVSTKKYIAQIIKNETYMDIGLIELDGEELKTIRDSKSHVASLNQLELLRLLRRNEYLSILNNLNIKIPDVSNTYIFSECKNIFQKLPIELVHNEVTSVLRKRFDSSLNYSVIENLPYSLKCLGLTKKMNKRNIETIKTLFI
jgi:hypothetical protein